jgi:hypothetical protein
MTPRRSADTSRANDVPADAARPAPRRVSFVTGRLAEPALRRTLAAMAPPFAYDVLVLKITVAALMTTDWIARHLHADDQLPDGTDLVMIPGLCEGNADVIGRQLGVRVEKGPKDLREIPQHFGRGPPRATTAPGISRSSPRSTTHRACRATPSAAKPITSMGAAPT